MIKNICRASTILCSFVFLIACGSSGESDGDTPSQQSYDFDDISFPSSVTVPVGGIYTYDVLSSTAGRTLSKDISMESVTGIYTSVSGFTVTGLVEGTDIIKATYKPTGDFKNLNVRVEDLEVQTLTITPDRTSSSAGIPIYLTLSGTTSSGRIDIDSLKSAMWSGEIQATWNEDTNNFIVLGYQPGNYSLTARLGGIQTSINLTITDPVPASIEWNTTTSSNVSVNSQYYGILQTTYTDSTVVISDSNATCTSDDPEIATISASPEEDGFLIQTYAVGSVLFTCGINSVPTTTRQYNVEQSIQTSWRVDNNHPSSNNCSSSKCTLAHLHKSENGSLAAVVESPNDSFRVFGTNTTGESLSYSSTVTHPTNAFNNSISQTTPSFTFGERGLFGLNYSYFDSELQSNSVGTQLYLISQLSPNSSISTSMYSTPTPPGSLLLSSSRVALGNGIIEQMNTDDNGGEPDDPEDAVGYVADFKSRLVLNGNINSTVRTTRDDNSTIYSSLVNEISNRNQTDEMATSYIDIHVSDKNLTQTFLFGQTGGEILSSTREFSSCGITADNIPDRLYVKQITYPKRMTSLFCFSDTHAYLWIYSDDSSATTFNFYSAPLQNDWVDPTTMQGMSYIGVDTPSDVFGQEGEPSIVMYMGYTGSQSVKTHYAVVFDNNILSTITPKATIGLNGEPYISNDLLGIPKSSLFNYVATSNTRELWTPYGTLGYRSDRENWSMNMGYAPFEKGAFIPFTYSRNGKKSQGLYLFTRGDADSVQYGTINIYYSDLFNLF